jgi:hypothetical protein
VRVSGTKVKINWFGVPWGPSWAFKKPESPKMSKMSIKTGNVRLYRVLTTKVSDSRPHTNISQFICIVLAVIYIF